VTETQEERTQYEPVRTHIVGTVRTVQERKDRSSNTYTVSVANVVADGQPRQVLPHAPNRCRATLIVTGTAGETAFLCSSQGEANNKQGAQIGPLSAPIPLGLTDELWLAQGTGSSIVIGVIAEYDD
jgi:hypothetical protein